MDRSHDREIWRLAVPAFLALVAEPLFLLADSAIVGHLGTTPLAGLGIAGSVLQTVVGLCVFLAYGTTASVARRIGAGDRIGALAQGIDGLWLAIVIGIAVTIPVIALAHPLARALGADPGVAHQATQYLQVAALGITPLLVMLAATGVLRGLLDTRTPMVVAIGGNLLNVVLNVSLVYGLHLGIRGSALGSVLAQLLAAVTLATVVVRGARRAGAPVVPHRGGILAAARGGLPMIVRTLTLRVGLLATTYAVTHAAGDHDTALATHQIAFSLWSFLSFVLDALAIAAQAITGRSLGAGDAGRTRSITARMVWWGVVVGVVAGLGLAAASPVLGGLFTDDHAVRHGLVPVLVVIAISQPICGVVFVLDGVLIGAGDGRYLAAGGVLTLVAYLPVLALAVALGGGLVWVWIVYSAVFMGARFAVLARRAAGTRWLILGVPGHS
jgi:putative MATE family efflux protein